MADKKVAKAAEPEEAPKKEAKPVVDDTPQGKTIDERMADLLRDHQAMGARPK